MCPECRVELKLIVFDIKDGKLNAMIVCNCRQWDIFSQLGQKIS